MSVATSLVLSARRCAVLLDWRTLHVALKIVQCIRRSARRRSCHITDGLLDRIVQSGKIASVDSIVYSIPDAAADPVNILIAHIFLYPESSDHFYAHNIITHPPQKSTA
jgi:hypothetical protein